MSEWINVSDVTPRIAYTATAGQTVFVVPFVFFEQTDLLVYQNGTLLTLAVNYTTTGAESESGGTVTLLVGATAGDVILIVREVPVAQTTHIPPSGPLDIPAINIQISKLVAMIQQIINSFTSAIHFPDGDATSGEVLPIATRKNKLMGFGTIGEIIYTLGPTFVGGTSTGAAWVDSRATAQVTTFDASVNTIQTGGYALPGDGGAALHKRVASIGAGESGFQSADGAWWQLCDPVFNVLMFGADRTGATDTTAAMQAAHDTGRYIHYPEGDYTFTTLSFAQGGIIGAGKGQSRLITTAVAAEVVITYTGLGSTATPAPIPRFENFVLTPSTTKSGGTGLKFIPSSNEGAFATISDVIINGMPTGIWFVAASGWTLTRSKILNYIVDGVVVDNTNFADSGDSTISECIFNTSLTFGNCITQKSSGGLKITNCKFLQGDRGFVLAFNGAVDTGILLISNCSFEGFTVQGIVLSRASGTKTFGKICIMGNEFAGIPTSITTDSSGAFYDLTIVGNAIGVKDASAGVAITLNSVDNFVVGNNVIRGPGGGAGTGISWTTCTNGLIMNNQIIGCASNVTPGSGSVIVANNPT